MLILAPPAGPACAGAAAGMPVPSSSDVCVPAALLAVDLLIRINRCIIRAATIEAAGIHSL
jgi:hypothetical protein